MLEPGSRIHHEAEDGDDDRHGQPGHQTEEHADADVARFALPGQPFPGEVVDQDQTHFGDKDDPLAEPGPVEDAQQAADGVGIDEGGGEPDADAGEGANRGGDDEANAQNFVRQCIPLGPIGAVCPPLDPDHQGDHTDGKGVVDPHMDDGDDADESAGAEVVGEENGKIHGSIPPRSGG